MIQTLKVYSPLRTSTIIPIMVKQLLHMTKRRLRLLLLPTKRNWPQRQPRPQQLRKKQNKRRRMDRRTSRLKLKLSRKTLKLHTKHPRSRQKLQRRP